MLFASIIDTRTKGRLDGSVFDNFFDIGPGTCEKFCIERNSCKSYNYNLQTFVCELNTAARTGIRDANYVTDPDFIYSEKNIGHVSI